MDVQDPTLILLQELASEDTHESSQANERRLIGPQVCKQKPIVFRAGHTPGRQPQRNQAQFAGARQPRSSLDIAYDAAYLSLEIAALYGIMDGQEVRSPSGKKDCNSAIVVHYLESLRIPGGLRRGGYDRALSVVNLAVPGYNGSNLVARLVTQGKIFPDDPAVLRGDYKDHADSHIEGAKHLDFVYVSAAAEVIKHRKNGPATPVNRRSSPWRKDPGKIFGYAPTGDVCHPLEPRRVQKRLEEWKKIPGGGQTDFCQRSLQAFHNI